MNSDRIVSARGSRVTFLPPTRIRRVARSGGLGRTAGALRPVMIGERRREVTAGVQDPPYVDLAFALDVEDQVREAVDWPGAQFGKVELVGEAQRSGVRAASDVMDGALDGRDEPTSRVVSAPRTE